MLHASTPASQPVSTHARTPGTETVFSAACAHVCVCVRVFGCAHKHAHFTRFWQSVCVCGMRVVCVRNNNDINFVFVYALASPTMVCGPQCVREYTYIYIVLTARKHTHARTLRAINIILFGRGMAGECVWCGAAPCA